MGKYVERFSGKIRHTKKEKVLFTDLGFKKAKSFKGVYAIVPDKRKKKVIYLP